MKMDTKQAILSRHALAISLFNLYAVLLTSGQKNAYYVIRFMFPNILEIKTFNIF